MGGHNWNKQWGRKARAVGVMQKKMKQCSYDQGFLREHRQNNHASLMEVIIRPQDGGMYQQAGGTAVFALL